MNIIDFPSYVLCGIMNYTSHLPGGLALTCTRTYDVAKSSRAKLDIVERRILSGSPSLVTHSSQMREAMRCRGRRLRRLCLIFSRWLINVKAKQIASMDYREMTLTLRHPTGPSSTLDAGIFDGDSGFVKEFVISTHTNVVALVNEIDYFSYGTKHWVPIAWRQHTHEQLVSKLGSKATCLMDMFVCLTVCWTRMGNEKYLRYHFGFAYTEFDSRCANGYYGVLPIDAFHKHYKRLDPKKSVV